MKKLFFILIAALFALSAPGKESEKADFKISHGPYLNGATETEATLVWTTSKPAVSWVEIAPDDDAHFYAVERKKFFDAPMGKKRASRLHAIKIDGLERGKKYRYRIFSTEVLGVEGYQVYYGKTASSKVYKAPPVHLCTLDSSKEKFSFRMINDIHADHKRLSEFLKGSDSADFLVYNGDMVSYMASEEQIFEGFMDVTSAHMKKSGRPMFYVRGNHEARGVFSEEFLNYFPTPTGKPYYAFRHGPAFFIVLDSGEDKPDSDIEYHGLADFDNYRAKQAEWLKSALESAECKSADVRIILVHIPPSWGDWHGSIHFRKLFGPIINSAGVDLVLSGHQHKHVFYPANKDGIDAPNIVNSNMEALDVEVSKDLISVRYFKPDGAEAREAMTFKPKAKD